MLCNSGVGGGGSGFQHKSQWSSMGVWGHATPGKFDSQRVFLWASDSSLGGFFLLCKAYWIVYIFEKWGGSALSPFWGLESFLTPLFLCLWIMNNIFHFHLQACTEMTLPSDTNNITDMFPPYNYNVSSYCMDKWNVRLRPDWMKTQFWGKSKYRYRTTP